MKDLAIKIAWKMWGMPYRWGGENPIEGFDCSGMVIEILQSVGILPKGDWTAHGLYVRFEKNIVVMPYAGCLVFWGNNDKVTHVEMAIDSTRTIGASGGGSKTTNISKATIQNAYVKIRPLSWRNKPFSIVDPFMVDQE